MRRRSRADNQRAEAIRCVSHNYRRAGSRLDCRTNNPRGPMANRKATFAKRQRETDLKDRAKQKDDRRNQKRGEVRDVKGPAIAWDEAVYAVVSPDDPPVAVDPDAVVPEVRPDGPTRPGDNVVGAAGDGPARSAAPPGAAAPAAAVDVAPVTPAPSAPAVKPAAAPAISGAAAGKPAASAAAPASPRRVG